MKLTNGSVPFIFQSPPVPHLPNGCVWKKEGEEEKSWAVPGSSGRPAMEKKRPWRRERVERTDVCAEMPEMWRSNNTERPRPSRPLPIRVFPLVLSLSLYPSLSPSLDYTVIAAVQSPSSAPPCLGLLSFTNRERERETLGSSPSVGVDVGMMWRGLSVPPPACGLIHTPPH